MTADELTWSTTHLLELVVGVVPGVRSGSVSNAEGATIARVGEADTSDRALVYTWPAIGSVVLGVGPVVDVDRVQRVADQLLASVSRLLAGPSVAELRAAA